MNYPNDPILPIVSASIRRAVKKNNSFSDEQQLKLIALTENQFTLLREED
jgi:hypothetical protein